MSDYPEFENKMKKTCDALTSDLGAIRAGRANTAVLNPLTVSYYGVDTPLLQVASVSTPDPRSQMIQPWDGSLLKAIEKAILASDLGINPQNDGRMIRLVFPQLTEERRKELRMLDRDDAEPSLRAEALFHLANMSNDASLYERCRKLDPKGRYAVYASFYHASAALESADAAASRRGLAELMEIVYGKDAALAKDALYLAAVHSYREAKYGESAALLKRYQKLYHGDARLGEVRRLVALSELMGGHYAAALACCTDDKDDTLVFVKATANERMGNRDEALALARKYLEEFPQ